MMPARPRDACGVARLRPIKESYLGQDERASALFYKVAAVVFAIAMGLFFWLANMAEQGT